MFYFEWDLTHRSLPRILPDSSYSPGVSLKFISKFDVRMNHHQSNVFHQNLSNYFHCWFDLYILHYSGVSQQFMVVFLIVILCIWRPKKSFSSKSYPFFQRFVVIACCHPLIIVFQLWEFFSPIRSNTGVFLVWFFEGHHFGFIHFIFQLSFSKSYRCIVQVFSS